MIAREIEEQTAPRLPRRLDDDHDRIAFAQWCARVLGVAVEWILQEGRGYPVEARAGRVALIDAPPAMAAMVGGLIATYPRPCGELAIRVLRVEPLPGGAP